VSLREAAPHGIEFAQNCHNLKVRLNNLLHLLKEDNIKMNSGYWIDLKPRITCELAQHRLDALNALFDIDQLLYKASNLEAVVEKIPTIIGSLLDYHYCLVYLWNPRTTQLEIASAKGFEGLLPQKPQAKSSLANLVFERGMAVNIPDLSDDALLSSVLSKEESSTITRYPFNKSVSSVLTIPVKLPFEMVGILQVASRRSNHFQLEDGQILALLARKIAQGIKLLRPLEARRSVMLIDPLTGLYTGKFFRQLLGREIQLARRSKTPLSLLFVDLDRFNDFNKTYGYFYADQFLMELSSLLKSRTRVEDLICRVESDKFLIALPRTNKESAQNVAQRLKYLLHQHSTQGLRQFLIPSDGEAKKRPDNHSLLKLTATVGVTSCPDDAEEEETLIHFAEEALKLGKSQGGDRVCIFPTIATPELTLDVQGAHAVKFGYDVKLSPQSTELDAWASLLSEFLWVNLILVTEALQAERASIMIIDEVKRELSLQVSKGLDDSTMRQTKLSMGTGIAGKVAQSGEPCLVIDIEESPFRGHTEEREYKTKSFISVPIGERNGAGSQHGTESLQIADSDSNINTLSDNTNAYSKVIGVINLSDKSTGEAFDADDFRLVMRATEEIACPLLHKKVGYADAVGSVCRILDECWTFWKGHSEHVAKYARKIGSQLQFPDEKIKHLWELGLLHDLGEIGLRAAVINKPGTLSEAEFAEVQQHPTIGEKICQSVRFLRPYMEPILHHHERLDASGYPDGKPSEALSIYARVLAVAEFFAALTEHRPYRPAMTIEKALSEMSQYAGIKLDERIVVALTEVVRREATHC